jgi:hypothetical protein
MKSLLTSLALAAAVLPALAAADEQMVVIDPVSERVLTGACGYLRSATRFSVDFDIEYEEVLLDGTTVTYHREDAIEVQRPDSLRMDVTDDKGERSIFVGPDGVVVYRPGNNVYAKLDSRGSLDERLASAERHGLTFPLDDLLKDKPCSDLVEQMQRVTYAGRHYLAGGLVHHLLIATPATALQLWIDDDDTPEIVKIAIQYRELTGQPRFTARLSNWNIETADNSVFTFTPPADASRVEFRKPATATGDK